MFDPYVGPLPVVAQLKAYNARDVDTFAPCFTEDVVIEDGRGNLISRGREEMYANYKKMFAENPDLHCQVVSRAHAGDWVVDEERITGRGPQELHLIVVYRLEGDQIAHVRLLR